MMCEISKEWIRRVSMISFMKNCYWRSSNKDPNAKLVFLIFELSQIYEETSQVDHILALGNKLS